MLFKKDNPKPVPLYLKIIIGIILFSVLGLVLHEIEERIPSSASPDQCQQGMLLAHTGKQEQFIGNGEEFKTFYVKSKYTSIEYLVEVNFGRDNNNRKFIKYANLKIHENPEKFNYFLHSISILDEDKDGYSSIGVINVLFLEKKWYQKQVDADLINIKIYFDIETDQYFENI